MLEAGWRELDQGRVWVRPDLEAPLREAGLDSLAGAFACRLGQEIKRNKDLRDIRRLELTREGAAVSVFLKRIQRLEGEEARRAAVEPRSAGAWAEVRNYLLLDRLGLKTLTPVAVGGQDQRSFSLTLALEGVTPLSKWVIAHYKQAPISLRRALIRQVAGLAARLHGAGYYHQDLNLHHFLWNNNEQMPMLYLVDLQRLKPLPRWGFRGRLKDIAELTCAASGLLGRRDGLAFARAYTGRPWGLGQKLFFGAARLKADRVARHNAKHGL